jgi:hypothetical protein
VEAAAVSAAGWISWLVAVTLILATLIWPRLQTWPFFCLIALVFCVTLFALDS